MNDLKSPLSNLKFLRPGAAIFILLCLALRGVLAGTNELDAVQLFKEGKLDEAQKQFEATARADPADAEARSYLGQIELKAQRYDKAVKWFEQATALSKTNIDHLLWLARAYGRLASKQGAPFGAGPAKKSKATLEKALTLAPEDTRARHGLIEFHLEAPGIVGGSVKEAYRQAEEIRKRDSYDGLIALADLYLRDKKFADATQALDRAIKEQPARLRARYRLARVQIAAGQHERAFETYEGIAASGAEGSQLAYLLMGEASARTGQRLEQGEAALKQYLEWQSPSNATSRAVAYLRLGNLYEKKQQPAEARAAYEKAVNLDKQNREAADALRRLRDLRK